MRFTSSRGIRPLPDSSRARWEVFPRVFTSSAQLRSVRALLSILIIIRGLTRRRPSFAATSFQYASRDLPHPYGKFLHQYRHDRLMIAAAGNSGPRMAPSANADLHHDMPGYNCWMNLRQGCAADVAAIFLNTAIRKNRRRQGCFWLGMIGIFPAVIWSKRNQSSLLRRFISRRAIFGQTDFAWSLPPMEPLPEKSAHQHNA